MKTLEKTALTGQPVEVKGSAYVEPEKVSASAPKTYEGIQLIEDKAYNGPTSIMYWM